MNVRKYAQKKKENTLTGTGDQGGGSQATPTVPYLAPDHRPRALDTPDMTSPTPVVPRTRQWDRKLPRGKGGGVCRLTGSGPRRALPALAPGSRSRRV